MNVMNIKHLLSAAATLGMLAACSEYDPGFSDKAVDLTDAEIQTLTEYTSNFVERYGDMDPNHTWGFGELAEMEDMGTRAVQVDRNNWAVAVKENNTVVGVTTAVGTDTQNANGSHYYEYTTKEGYIIPGFPSTVDGKYYIEENNRQVGYTEDQIKSKMQYNQVQPVGDVTDEEIEYVSWWFRTHPNITSETPPFTEYFVQDISQDLDRVTYPNGEWIDELNGSRQVPVKLYQNGQYVRDENPEGINYGMDYFSVQTKESDGSYFWEHNNNLNKQKANPIAESGSAVAATATDTTALTTSTTTYSNRTLKYWTSEGPSQNISGQVSYKNGEGFTTSFSYRNSNDDHDYQNYVLVHLKFKGPRTGLDYDGWYLGFDYQLHKQTDVGNGQVKKTDVEPDGYYSNWIVKLAPGNPEFYKKTTRTRTIERRVMCEDLGSTFDFDFNDLVFDVKYTREEESEDNGETWTPVGDGKWTATITLQASGGMLPIFIKNFDGTQYDCHQMLGGTANANNRYTPINVGLGPVSDPVALPSCQVESTNPDDIVILVYSNDAERSATKELELPSSKGLQNFGENLAPQKICMPVGVRWTKESQQIEWAYPNFAEWVASENGAAGFGNEHDWTETSVEKYLY